MELLLKKGANQDARNRSKNIPLDVARDYALSYAEKNIPFENLSKIIKILEPITNKK